MYHSGVITTKGLSLSNKEKYGLIIYFVKYVFHVFHTLRIMFFNSSMANVLVCVELGRTNNGKGNINNSAKPHGIFSG